MIFKIKIGGEERPVSFGINQTALFCDKYKIPLEKIGEQFRGNMTLLQFRDLLWSGLAAGVYENGGTPDFNEWKVGSWVDEMKPDEITGIVEKFTLSNPTQKKKKVQAKPQLGKT